MSRRARFRGIRAQRRVRKLFVIATEGSKTEAHYFALFQGPMARKNIKIEVLPTRGGASSPAAILRRLNEYAHKNQLSNSDELWLVIDVDRWGDKMLQAVATECKKRKFHTAVSNPSFELWLLLHQEKPRIPRTVKECIRELERLLGAYDKAEYDTSVLADNVHYAIEHARRLHQSAEDPEELWPKEPGSHVYLLVSRILAA